MQQKHYSVKTFPHHKIIPLKSLQNSVRDCMICHKKKIQELLNTITEKKNCFQGFEKAVMNFKYFQALQGLVQTLYAWTWSPNN